MQLAALGPHSPYQTVAKNTRSIWKMLGPFATASRRTPIHQVSLLSHASYSYSAGGMRCPRQQRRQQQQRVTEGTAMAP